MNNDYTEITEKLSLIKRFFGRSLLICLFTIFIQANVIAQGDAGSGELSREEKIQKANEHYLAGQQFIQQGNYASADEEFKKAQQLLQQGPSLEITSKAVPPVNEAKPPSTEVQPQRTPIMSEPQPQSLEIQPPAAKAWESAKKGESKEAISLYLKAIALNPQDANLHYNLAVEYLRTNQFKEAAQSLKKVVQLNPKDKDAYYNLGVLYETYLGDKKQALDYYSRYIELAPHAEDAGKVKVWIRQIKKEEYD